MSPAQPLVTADVTFTPSLPLLQDFNILRYNKDQYYESHLDAFDPKEYGPQGSQRVATVLLILQAPEEGGETVFKKEGKGNANKDVQEWRKCLDSDFKYT
jgi:prolyl 4-hydroxylase